MFSTEGYIEMDDTRIHQKLVEAIEVAETQGDEEVLRILACAMSAYLNLVELRQNNGRVS